MKKSIEVIIKKQNLYNSPIKKLQRVSIGYAFNYLIPNQMAEIATKGKIKHLNMLQNIVEKKNNQIDNNKLKIKNNIDKIKIIFLRKKCSQNKQIFGSISEQDITNKIYKITGYNINKKQMNIKPIKEIGQYLCAIRIDIDIYTEIEVHILPTTLNA